MDPVVKPSIEASIIKEIQKGNYVVTDRVPTIVRPIGAVPKSDGGYRLIHDCSLPKGACLNDFSPDFDKCSYESVDDAVSLIKPGYYLAKLDIKSAYRHIPISLSSQQVTGLLWRFSDGNEVHM